jgi:hypothetical protein
MLVLTVGVRLWREGVSVSTTSSGGSEGTVIARSIFDKAVLAGGPHGYAVD